VHGKIDRDRVVGLDDGAMALINRWLDVRRQRGINGRGAKRLFCTLDGGPVSGAYVRAMLKRMARRAGIEKRVHPHGLRHTGAAELRSEGVDIGIISKQLGHKSIATTARYLDHIAPQTVIDTMRKREWSL
jgi:site-specific recombinase XerD